MSNQIKIFDNPTFGAVRIVTTENNEPLFCLTDVCQALDLGNPSQVKTRLEDTLITNEVISDSLGRQRNILFVNEDGLYDVILDSRKPEAKQFRKWVTSEVLPQIRKTGGYIKTEDDDTPDVIMAKALILAQKTIESQTQQNQILKHTNQILEEEKKILLPKAEYTDQVLNSTDTHTFSEVAKSLGLTSAIALYNKCRTLGVIFKQGDKYLPYSKYSTQGYFATRTYPFFRKDGTQGTSTTLVVTELGRAFLRKKLQKQIA